MNYKSVVSVTDSAGLIEYNSRLTLDELMEMYDPFNNEFGRLHDTVLDLIAVMA